MVSIIETSEHAAKNYLSTLAVLQLDAVLIGAKKKFVKKVKEGNKNQKPFEKMLIMEYELTGIGIVKMTVGVRRRTHETFIGMELTAQGNTLYLTGEFCSCQCV